MIADLKNALINKRLVSNKVLKELAGGNGAIGEQALSRLLEMRLLKHGDLEETMIDSMVAPQEKLGVGFSILSYNQNILQFADSKANTLIVINSIFIASATTFFGTTPKSLLFLSLMFFALSIYATALCLLVVTPRSDSSLKMVRAPRKDLIFFGDILTRDSKKYVRDYKRYRYSEFLEDLAYRIYRVALIASDKYKILSKAQTFTTIAALFWLLNVIVTVIGHLI